MTDRASQSTTPNQKKAPQIKPVKLPQAGFNPESKEIIAALNKLDKKDPTSGKDIDPKLLANKDFIKLAANKAPHILEYASQNIRNDKDFIHSLIVDKKQNGFTSYNPYVMQHLPKDLLNNKAFITGLLKDGFNALDDASETLRRDKSMYQVLKETKNEININNIPKDLLADKEFITECFNNKIIRSYGKVNLSQLFPEKLLNDREFIKLACLSDRNLIENLPGKYGNNVTFIKELVTTNSSTYSHINPALKLNKDIATIAFKGDPFTASDFPKQLQKDEKFMISLLKQNGNSFKYLSDEIRGNTKYILAAVETNSDVVTAVSVDILKNNKELVKEIATKNFNTKGKLESVLGKLDPEVEKIFSNTEKAFKILNFSKETYETTSINGKPSKEGRYDATQDIIRNRYEVANKEIQRELRQVLGADYFKKQETQDNRPTILVVLPKLDHNDAFHQNKSIFFSTDAFDELTRNNKVIIYDVGSKTELSDVLSEVKKHGQVDHLVIGAHGQKNVMSFGYDETKYDKFDWKEHGDLVLTVNDSETFDKFSGVVKNDGKVILLSCSTGKKENKNEVNIADSFHSVLPKTTLYAPSDPTVVVTLIDKQSGLLSIPNFRKGFETIPSYVLNPKEEIEFSYDGLSSKEEKAAKFILSRTNTTHSFKLESFDNEQEVILESNGEKTAFRQYNSEKNKIEAIKGIALTEKAAKLLLHSKLTDILFTGESAKNLWDNWDKKSTEEGFIASNNKDLIKVKENIAKELNIDPEKVKLDLNKVPGALVGNIFIETTSGQKILSTTTLTQAGFQNDSDKLNLALLGQEMN